MSCILVKDMKMPDSCSNCKLCACYTESKGEVYRCDLTMTPVKHFEIRLEDCPLVEVSTPHGRLIDADAYREEIRERYESAREWYKGANTDDIKARAESALFTFTECSLTLRKMPTIIEGEAET